MSYRDMLQSERDLGSDEGRGPKDDLLLSSLNLAFPLTDPDQAVDEKFRVLLGALARLGSERAENR